MFITRGFEKNLDTIREIIMNSSFINLIVVITANSDILSSESNMTYSKLQENFLNWLPDNVSLPI